MRSRGLQLRSLSCSPLRAAAVILYTQGVKEDAEQGGELTTVIVSSQSIPPSQRLDSLIDQGVFGEVDVPRDTLVSGAVTDIRQLEGQTTVSEILANEQIPLSRLSSGEGNPVGVSEGHIGVAVELEAPQGGTGNINPATTSRSSRRSRTSRRSPVARPAPSGPDQPVRDLADGAQGGPPRLHGHDHPERPRPAHREPLRRHGDRRAERQRQHPGDLDLLPQDAQNLVFAQENGLVWLGLLHPADEDGSRRMRRPCRSSCCSERD